MDGAQHAWTPREILLLHTVFRWREIRTHTRHTQTHQIQFRHGTPVRRECLWWASFDWAAAEINQNIYEIKRERESMYVVFSCAFCFRSSSRGVWSARALFHNEIEKNKFRNNKLSTVHFGRGHTIARMMKMAACNGETMLCSLI